MTKKELKKKINKLNIFGSGKSLKQVLYNLVDGVGGGNNELVWHTADFDNAEMPFGVEVVNFDALPINFLFTRKCPNICTELNVNDDVEIKVYSKQPYEESSDDFNFEENPEITITEQDGVKQTINRYHIGLDSDDFTIVEATIIQFEDPYIMRQLGYKKLLVLDVDTSGYRAAKIELTINGKKHVIYSV